MGRAIFYNGRFYTLDNKNLIVQAVAVEDGTIIGMGTNRDVFLQYDTPNTKKIDFQGKTVSPGLIDSHLHISGVAQKFLSLDLTGIASKNELLQQVKQKAKNSSEDEWVVGRGWDESLFHDSSTIPTIEELDQVSLSKPVFLTRICGHAFLANTKAIEISKQKNNPVHEPMGSLLKESEADFIKKSIPHPSYEELKNAVRKALELAIQNGLTSVHTEDLRYLGGLDQTYRIYDELINEENIRLRCNLLIYHPYLDDLVNRNMYTGYGNDYLKIGAIKVFADGALGGRTALLSEPYEDDPDNYGREIHSFDQLNKIIREVRKHNFPVAVHVIGDKALENTLQCLSKLPPTKFKDRLIHCQILRDDLIKELKSPNIIADIQPRFLVSDFPGVIDRLGEERVKNSYAWKTMLLSGIACAGGSDAPVEPINPLLGIHAAVTRSKPGNPSKVWLKEERLSVMEAVKLFTTGGAYAVNEENKKGTISIGKWADFTVYSKDIFTVEPEELLTTDIVMTVIGGEICFEG